jgi:hypothetical protein
VKKKRGEKIWGLSRPFVKHDEGSVLEKAMLRRPARDSAELDAFVLAQINEGERSLLLQGQLWHSRQDFFLWCNASRLATFHNAGQMLASA